MTCPPCVTWAVALRGALAHSQVREPSSCCAMRATNDLLKTKTNIYININHTSIKKDHISIYLSYIDIYIYDSTDTHLPSTRRTMLFIADSFSMGCEKIALNTKLRDTTVWGRGGTVAMRRGVGVEKVYVYSSSLMVPVGGR